MLVVINVLLYMVGLVKDFMLAVAADLVAMVLSGYLLVVGQKVGSSALPMLSRAFKSG